MSELSEEDIDAALDETMAALPTSDDPDTAMAYRSGVHDGATEMHRRLMDALNE